MNDRRLTGPWRDTCAERPRPPGRAPGSQTISSFGLRRIRESTNIVVIEPDVADAFPTEAAVNEALRGILNTTRAVRHSGGLTDKALDRERSGRTSQPRKKRARAVAE